MTLQLLCLSDHFSEDDGAVFFFFGIMAETENVKAADLVVYLPWQQLPDNVDKEGFFFSLTPLQRTLM